MAVNNTQPENQKPTGNLYMAPTGKSYATEAAYKATINPPIQGVSPSVSSAAYAAGYNPNSPTPSSSQFGASSMIGVNNSMSNAMNSAISSMPQKNTWDKMIAPASMPGYAGNKRKVPNPDYIEGSVNPATVSQDTTSQQPTYDNPVNPSNTSNIDVQFNLNKDKLEQDYNTQKTSLETEKNSAVKAAEASYDTNNPEGSGSDKQQYLSGIASKYDTALVSLKKNYDTAVSQSEINYQNSITQSKKDASSMLNTSIDNFQKIITGNPDIAKLFNDSGEITGSYDKVQAFIQTAKGMGVPEDLAIPMMKSEVANSKAKQAQIDAQAANAEIAQRRADLAERSASRADAMLGLALNRDIRADQTAARQQATAIAQQFSKANTASQALSVGQQYLARIEAASGEGVSALGLIDALVKLDTGGQAVRQGQTELLTESGTWGDSWKRLKAKMGQFSNTTGANTILTKNQVTQIKNQAKKIAQEQINAALPSYIESKESLNSIKNDYPTEADKIDGYATQLKSAETFIQKYGSTADKKAAGISDSPAEGSSSENSNSKPPNPLGI